MTAATDLAAAEAMDAADPLSAMRGRFVLPEGVIYLDGNSLGAASPTAFAEVERATREEWAEGLIRSWNSAGWFDMPVALGDRIGRLVGAATGQTVVADTTSINIYKALHAAMGLRPDRNVIVAEGGSFPTDLYMAEGVIATRPGTALKLEGVDAPTIEELIDDKVAVVLVNHVNYKSGELRDMAAVTKKAHDAGALVVWDLCHTAGALPIELDAANADFAVGCTYKYLNGGPGAPAFIYVAKRHLAQARQPLSGWWGHARPFAFEKSFDADPGIRRFQCGTQGILSLRALKGALDIWDEVDMQALRAKSIALTDLFIALCRCVAGGGRARRHFAQWRLEGGAFRGEGCGDVRIAPSSLTPPDSDPGFPASAFSAHPRTRSCLFPGRSSGRRPGGVPTASCRRRGWTGRRP